MNKLHSRTWLEAAGWVGLVAMLWGTDLLAKMTVLRQDGIGKDAFTLISEQVTSAIAVLVMIFFVIRWLKLFPLRRDAWIPAIIGHTIGTALFACGHYILMVAMRLPWYEINGHEYIWREPFFTNLFVEYQKDIKIYLGIIFIATVYALYRRPRQRTEAAPGRMVVQTGSGTSVLRFDQIDYFEAARNYIVVHAENREYIVRDTMANMVARLAGASFVRTHRGFIVNVDKIREIRRVDSTLRIFLYGGNDVPLSRGYRDEFNKTVGDVN